MELVSLRELCEEVGVSRRSVQGYEKAGVINAESKNKYGYLLYSREMVERAKLIKFYRDIGVRNAEIAQLMEAPSNVLVNALKERIGYLEERMEKTKLLIDKTQLLITEILRQYFINHPQSIDKYTFLQNSAFTHWVKEKCSKMC